MREKLIELLNRWPCFGTAEEHADHLIANGVEIPVHCCDCAKCITHIDDVGCPWLFCERQNGRPVDPTDFCSYGERREGE